MRSVQPSADLPASNSQTMLGYNSLPARPQRTTARNMTGIYLGSESSRSNTRTRHSIPPLAKPRGVSVGTAADRRRQPALHSSLDSTTAHQTHPRHSVQGTSACNNILDPDYISNTLLYVYHHQTPAPIPLPYTPPMILRLPILRPKQQQRVEALRLKEEPRGFNPLPVKKPTKPKASRKPEDRINNSIGKHALDYSGITRKTGRNFVPVANSGVKRLEDLRSEAGSVIAGTGSIRNGSDNMPRHPSPAHDIKVNNKKNLIGLEDCYKRICKGNLSNLQHVMHKNQGGTSRTKAKLVTTPLTIRSFRNPQNPHPVVQYTDPKHRPKTTVSPTVNRPPVPAPYYYNSKSLPRTADDGSNRVRLTREHDAFPNHERVLAAPGAGVISASAFRKRNSLPNESTSGIEGRPPSGISGSRPPCLGSNTKIFDSDEMFAQRDGFKVPSGTPAASNTDLTKLENIDDAMQYSENHHTVSILKQTDVPPPSPATLHRMRIMANKNNSGSDYDSELDTRDGIESTVSLPTIGTRPDTRAELMKIADSGIEEQDEEDGANKMEVSIVISVEDEMGRHVDVNIEEEAGKMDVEDTALSDVNPAESDQSVSSNIAQAAQEASIQKQSELQQLIQEHNALVHHIEELEKLKPTFSDDDISSDEGT